MNESPVNAFRVRQIKLPLAAIMAIGATFAVSGQTNESRGRNNPFSPSPPHKVKKEVPVSAPAKSAPRELPFIAQSQDTPQIQEDQPTIARTTVRIANDTDLAPMSATDIYKIGVGDVLFINLKDVSQGSGYYTVRVDGTIDFPLAGGNVAVVGQTVDMVENILVSGIKILRDARIEVRVREYASHKITVSGMVDRPGEKSLQREAMPLFAIRAEAGVDSRATKVLIKRAPLQNHETYVLSDADTDKILIYPGNSVEFTSDRGNLRIANSTYYFVSGEVISPGQREFNAGLTLYQALIASGGPKGDPKKAIIRRKNFGGILVGFEHNLRAIKGGKAPDPSLLAGDVIEVKN